MRYTSELYCLTLISVATALMWVPYVLARMTTHGVLRAIGTPGPDYPVDEPWADRARRAHLNAIENLTVFAPLVLVGAIIDVSNRATVLSAQVYVAARLVHYVIYVRASRHPNVSIPDWCMCDDRHCNGAALSRASVVAADACYSRA